jgi:hypothetical protein
MKSLKIKNEMLKKIKRVYYYNKNFKSWARGQIQKVRHGHEWEGEGGTDRTRTYRLESSDGILGFLI